MDGDKMGTRGAMKGEYVLNFTFTAENHTQVVTGSYTTISISSCLIIASVSCQGTANFPELKRLRMVMSDREFSKKKNAMPRRTKHVISFHPCSAVADLAAPDA